MTPEDFAAQTLAAAARIERLSAEGVSNANAILRDTQADIALRLANAPTDYNQWYYSQMQQDLERVANELSERYEAALGESLDQAAETVLDAVDRPLEQAGITVALPRVSRQTVEMLSGFRPGELIKGLAGDLKTRVQQQLQQAILGVLSPWELQKSLAQNLEAGGTFGGIASRAETIWRTEAARVYNVLAQERYRRIETMQPGRMRKQWLHSGNAQQPRANHLRLNGVTIPITAKYLVNIYEADGPHDPVLPASETIRCGCTLRLVLAD